MCIRDRDKRQIYVLVDNDLVASSNYTQEGYEKSIAELPEELKEDEPVIYGETKNQPLVYLKKTDPDVTIIVIPVSYTHLNQLFYYIKPHRLQLKPIRREYSIKVYLCCLSAFEN